MRGRAWSLAAATTAGEVVVERWGGHRRVVGGGLFLFVLELLAWVGVAGGGLRVRLRERRGAGVAGQVVQRGTGVRGRQPGRRGRAGGPPDGRSGLSGR